MASVPTRAERKLRSTVRRYGACLGRLPALEKRVLVLRAALDRPRVRTRTRVAEITGVRVRVVRHAERTGLKSLRRLGRAGGCAVELAPSTLAATLAAPSAAAPTDLAVDLPGRSPGQGVKSEHASGGSGASPAPESAAPPASAKPLIAGAPATDEGGTSDGINPLMILIPLLLIAYVAWVVRGEHRKRHAAGD